MLQQLPYCEPVQRYPVFPPQVPSGVRAVAVGTRSMLVVVALEDVVEVVSRGMTAALMQATRARM